MSHWHITVLSVSLKTGKNVVLKPGACVAVLKTGASGMIAYRLQCKDLSFQYLQTSSRLVYKNSKPDFIISTHRPLT
jgi:hypothetical protein